jgi:hypothetical protein
MSPIRTFGSNLKVETNINGQLVDNEEFIEYKNNYNHTHHPTESWQQGYQAQVEEELIKDLLTPPPEPITDTSDIDKVNRRDLLIRGIKDNTTNNNQ